MEKKWTETSLPAACIFSWLDWPLITNIKIIKSISNILTEVVYIFTVRDFKELGQNSPNYSNDVRINRIGQFSATFDKNVPRC